MKNKFLQVSAGVTMMLLGAGFFVRSFNTVQAAPTPQMFQEAGTNKIGKYQIALTSYDSKNYGLKVCAIIWDTETGASIQYLQSHDNVWSKRDNQLPSRPFGN